MNSMIILYLLKVQCCDVAKGQVIVLWKHVYLLILSFALIDFMSLLKLVLYFMLLHHVVCNGEEGYVGCY
jgi:hypothetical protein